MRHRHGLASAVSRALAHPTTSKPFVVIRSYRTKTTKPPSRPPGKSLTTLSTTSSPVLPPSLLLPSTSAPTSIPTSASTATSTTPIILPGSTNHSCLPSFLTHAASTSLSPSSPVYKGTLYEYLVARALLPYGFTLTRVGRTSDAGIDLLGEWNLPVLPIPLRVILQCKAHARPLAPTYVRELEGAVGSAPAGWRNGMGLLAGMGRASRGVREAVGRAPGACGYICVDGRGVVRQVVWNWRAEEMGLCGVGVTLRYEEGEEGVVALTWKGVEIEGVGVSGQEALEMPVVDIGDLDLGRRERSNKKVVEMEVGVIGRKRGRPRKVVVADFEKAIKKRGRPKKVVEVEVAVRTRGRPRKDKVNAKNDVQVETMMPIPKRKPGRPKKMP
ncbi:hypothetical protein BT63DRAFT_281820 [Microthyrium microscopicum]|uniref:Restriction endonuclease type IV Mrr domain-containing protein n=1 Tax=Microthyrium microscopicum TaxID=703497 RepID=A0A6A6U9J6_9PEZI|nr:hypothetical protein BT63DRAFT_281820 [Microthyrium microscopicum]